MHGIEGNGAVQEGEVSQDILAKNRKQGRPRDRQTGGLIDGLADIALNPNQPKMLLRCGSEEHQKFRWGILAKPRAFWGLRSSAPFSMAAMLA